MQMLLKLLLPDDLHQHPFPSSPVEFTIENLFPWSKIKSAAGDGDNDFPSHDLPLQVGVSVILARTIMMVLRNRLVGSDLFQPFFIILV